MYSATTARKSLNCEIVFVRPFATALVVRLVGLVVVIQFPVFARYTYGYVYYSE